ncbi:MAG: ABC transporter ATP-binding protein [Verrucomicrobia bacterium]|nr:ABC transporter ATP-binding protein [Verrucomicrobiota bacterium]
MSPNALELKDVRKRYGKRLALDGLNLGVPAGSVCGLVGSNGAGKTTAMAVTVALVRHEGGTVNVLGDGPFDATKHAGRVSLMPQDSLMPPYARVAEILSFYAALQGIPHRLVHEEVTRVIGLVHLSDRAGSQIRTLSHGMRRRVAIAQCLLGEPDLVLMDEPTSGLDPREVQNLREVLQKRKPGQTVVISSHILSELERMCDCVAFIDKGKTTLQDSMDAVTGRSSVLNYLLTPGAIPLDRLRQLLPRVIFESAENGGTLVCRYQPADYRPEEVNKHVLESLLQVDIGVIEVRLGSGLEKAYLQTS